MGQVSTNLYFNIGICRVSDGLFHHTQNELTHRAHPWPKLGVPGNVGERGA